MSDPIQDPIPPQPRPLAYVPPAPTAAALSDNVAGALAYFTIIPAIIFLILEPYNRIPFVRFHSFQSIGFCVLAFVLQIALMIVDAFLHLIPLAWILIPVLHGLLGLALLIAWIVVVFKASQGQWYKLRIVGDFAEKQARG